MVESVLLYKTDVFTAKKFAHPVQLAPSSEVAKIEGENPWCSENATQSCTFFFEETAIVCHSLDECSRDTRARTTRAQVALGKRCINMVVFLCSRFHAHNDNAPFQPFWEYRRYVHSRRAMDVTRLIDPASSHALVSGTKMSSFLLFSFSSFQFWFSFSVPVFVFLVPF